jgi:hypothetical protein
MSLVVTQISQRSTLGQKPFQRLEFLREMLGPIISSADCSNIRRCSPLASTLLDVGRQYTLRSQLEDPGQGQYFGALHSLVPGARSAIGSVPESVRGKPGSYIMY